MSEITEDTKRTLEHEYVLGYEVYAYCEESEFGGRFSTHWSTPTREPIVRLFTEQQLRSALTAALQAAEAQPVESANKAEAILLASKAVIAAEWKHKREMDQGSTRDVCDYALADLVGFSVADVDQALAIVRRKRKSAPTPSHSLAEAENADIIPNLDLLSPEEKKALLTKAENLWRDLERNELGGYSYGNRPFYILEAFRSAIEDFGKRNTGYRHSKNEIDAHEAALSIAREGE
jgi:hypothetical protein